MTGKYIDWAEIERKQMLDREAAVVANLNKKLGISEPKPEPEPEPNALQEENDRLKEESAHWQKQYQESVATGALVLVRIKDQDALIKELREALRTATMFDWERHSIDFAGFCYDELIHPAICKQIFEALHRKV
jgi:FtsZ-binding cell division protein ZapB